MRLELGIIGPNARARRPSASCRKDGPAAKNRRLSNTQTKAITKTGRGDTGNGTKRCSLTVSEGCTWISFLKKIYLRFDISTIFGRLTTSNPPPPPYIYIWWVISSGENGSTSRCFEVLASPGNLLSGNKQNLSPPPAVCPSLC